MGLEGMGIVAIQGVNPAAQAIGNLVPLKENTGTAQAAAPAVAPDAQKQAEADVNVALKPGQAANITLEQPGVAAGGPGGIDDEMKKALGQIKEQLDGLIKQLTGLFEKLGIKLPEAGGTPATGGIDPAPAAAGAANANPTAAGAANTNPAQPVAGGPAAAGANPAAVAAEAPRDGAPGQDGAPGKDGAPAPADPGQTIIINQKNRGLFGGIHDFLFGAPAPQVIQVGGGDGKGGGGNVQVIGGGGGGQGGLLGGVNNFLFGGDQQPQVIKAGANTQVVNL